MVKKTNSQILEVQWDSMLKLTKNIWGTDKSLSEALPFAEHGENMLCTRIVLNVRNNFCAQYVLPRFELGMFIYWTCNSMNNLLSFCGLVDAKIRASHKDLAVTWIDFIKEVIANLGQFHLLLFCAKIASLHGLDLYLHFISILNVCWKHSLEFRSTLQNKDITLCNLKISKCTSFNL